MTTTTVPIAITCPDWCTVSAEDHVDELWNAGGECNHHAPITEVIDTAGYQEPLEAPVFHNPFSVTFSTRTRPDGTESASPVFYVNDHETSCDQALALADEIKRLVELYRSESPA